MVHLNVALVLCNRAEKFMRTPVAENVKYFDDVDQKLG